VVILNYIISTTT